MKLPLIVRNPSLVLRLSLDLLLLHLSMFLAVLSASIFYRILYAAKDLSQLDSNLVQCYEVFALCVAPLFLGVLYVNGIYSRKSLAAKMSSRLNLLLRAISISALLCLAANYMFLRNHIVARGIVLFFFTFVLLLFFLSRWIEQTIHPHIALVHATARGQRPFDAPVLVIGGAGYIGSMLCRKLLADGERVRVLDSLVYGDFAVRELKAHPRFELIRGDCRNIQSVVSAIRDVKSIVHLAAIVGDPACEQDQLSALEINYASTRMLIEVARGHNIDRVVFASSCSVYGATDEIMDEHSPVVPISLYGRTKVESERALLEASSDEFHPVILRLATVFGHGYRPRFDLLVNLLSARAANEGFVTIYNQQQWRPFIHVWDVACGFATALNAPIHKVSGQVFNLGDNRMNYTLGGVVNEVQRSFPQTKVQMVVNEDKRTYRVDFSKIHAELGYQCTISLREGIEELKRSFKNGSVTDYHDLRYHNQRFLAAAGTPPAQHEMDHRIMAAFSNKELFLLSKQDVA